MTARHFPAPSSWVSPSCQSCLFFQDGLNYFWGFPAFSPARWLHFGGVESLHLSIFFLPWKFLQSKAFASRQVVTPCSKQLNIPLNPALPPALPSLNQILLPQAFLAEIQLLGLQKSNLIVTQGLSLGISLKKTWIWAFLTHKNKVLLSFLGNCFSSRPQRPSECPR